MQRAGNKGEEMTRAELLEKFRSMASEIAEKDFSDVAEDASIKDLGIDSLGMLELVGELERELEVRIPDDNLVGIQTVRQLLELVERRLQPAPSA